MLKLLLTGFEPFGGEAVNPSRAAVEFIAENPPPGLRLATAILPTSYSGAAPALRRAIARCAPDAVIAVGQAGGRAALSVERIAINVDDGRIADNEGAWRIDAPVIPGGPAGYFSSLPIKAMVAAMREAGVPAGISQTAGTFLCNHIFYVACHIAATERPGMRAGFIHVPFLPGQVAADPSRSSMDLSLMVKGLRAVLETVRDLDGADLAIAEGATH